VVPVTAQGRSFSDGSKFLALQCLSIRRRSTSLPQSDRNLRIFIPCKLICYKVKSSLSRDLYLQHLSIIMSCSSYPILKGHSPVRSNARSPSGTLPNPKAITHLADHAKTGRTDHTLAHLRLYFTQKMENKSSSFSAHPSRPIPSIQR
jgi:hypothetical protein